MKTKSRFTDRSQILSRLESADDQAEEARMIAYACERQKHALVLAGMPAMAPPYAELAVKYSAKHRQQLNRRKHFGKKLAEFDTLPLPLPGMDESVERSVS